MNYAILDRSALPQYLFYPRRDGRKPPPGAFDLPVAVEKDLFIVCRAFPGKSDQPWILYFHGNGETAVDYDSIAPYYNRQGLSLLVADYRGYGSSGGWPTFAALINDAHAILKAVRAELPARGFRQDLWVMGRSLGSISALELAFHYPGLLKGVIFESGFIGVYELVNHLGLPVPEGMDELERGCREIAEGVSIPVLVIHGEEDALVPLEQGRSLYEALGAEKKDLVVIQGAGHNDIFFTDRRLYLEAVSKFVESTS